MTAMITPKQDLYMDGTEDCFAKKGKWYVSKGQDKFGDFMFIDEMKQDHYYEEDNLNKDFHTIDFEKGFSYKFKDQEYSIKDYKWGCETKVPVETCVICIERGYWEITRYSNEKEKSILSSFPVPENNSPKYNPVKNISREKYYRCAKRNPNLCDQFNSDKGILFMSESSCGKYYYWEGYNSDNSIIYLRGEKSWVEGKYVKAVAAKSKKPREVSSDVKRVIDKIKDNLKEEVVSGESKTSRFEVNENGSLAIPKGMTANEVMEYICDYVDYLDECEKDVLKSKEDEENLSTWTDKHYDFNYTLTEEDIEKGILKIDPYFVNRMWRINSWDDTGAAFHSLKNYARICNGKNPLERDLKSLYKQVKRLCELHKVEL
tara:strand:+ start:844 stop:1968 length:1125 start_codon:yes stop_codon:yes gene_type:complete